MKNFSWAFRQFLRRRHPDVFKNVGYGPRTAYTWQYPIDAPHYRKDPITKALEVLDLIYNLEPDIGIQVLTEFVQYFGYQLVPLQTKETPIKLHELEKELHDVIHTELQALDDGKYDEEEIKQLLKEIREAVSALIRREIQLKFLLKKSGGEER